MFPQRRPATDVRVTTTCDLVAQLTTWNAATLRARSSNVFLHHHHVCAQLRPALSFAYITWLYGAIPQKGNYLESSAGSRRRRIQWRSSITTRATHWWILLPVTREHGDNSSPEMRTRARAAISSANLPKRLLGAVVWGRLSSCPRERILVNGLQSMVRGSNC